MKNSAKASFVEVADISRAFVHSLSLSEEPPADLNVVLGELRTKLDCERVRLASALNALPVTSAFKGRMSRGCSGLNTVGMLADRCTILLMKEWCIQFRGRKDAAAAKMLKETQTHDIIEALNLANPGTASTHAKITHLKGGATASTWGEAFAGLLCANILLWEAQEILYVRDIKKLPSEELRSYIEWFARGNMLRNEYIQLLEELFWGQVIFR